MLGWWRRASLRARLILIGSAGVTVGLAIAFALGFPGLAVTGCRPNPTGVSAPGSPSGNSGMGAASTSSEAIATTCGSSG